MLAWNPSSVKGNGEGSCSWFSSVIRSVGGRAGARSSLCTLVSMKVDGTCHQFYSTSLATVAVEINRNVFCWIALTMKRARIASFEHTVSPTELRSRFTSWRRQPLPVSVFVLLTACTEVLSLHYASKSKNFHCIKPALLLLRVLVNVVFCLDVQKYAMCHLKYLLLPSAPTELSSRFLKAGQKQTIFLLLCKYCLL